ncbi:MAG: ribbon-helix-helix protein, CopG family [Deltaproteobacteria bacterium]|nr:ribbon-helix-helix protein, CopG family [Deltaproteobacteria bacterium]
MSNALTIKLSPSLLQRLSAAATHAGLSKGALLRQALEKLLATQHTTCLSVEQLTEALRRGKQPRIAIDWAEIYRKCRASPDAPLPEEEVRAARRRGL